MMTLDTSLVVNRFTTWFNWFNRTSIERYLDLYLTILRLVLVSCCSYLTMSECESETVFSTPFKSQSGSNWVCRFDAASTN